MTIRTILNFGRWEVVKHFRCETCHDHFFMARRILDGYVFSKLWETECRSHAEFCLMKEKAKELVTNV